MEKRPLIKYTLEELRKLIPTVQDWHLLYYLMYKHEWDEDVINYKFKKICIVEKERINKIKLLDETLKYMTPLNPDYNNLIIQHSQLISSLESNHFGDYLKKRKMNSISFQPSEESPIEMKNEIEQVVDAQAKKMKPFHEQLEEKEDDKK